MVPVRPQLSRNLRVEDFNGWYWLKADLQAFCREQALPASGSKEELQARVRAWLGGGVLPPVSRTKVQKPIRPELLGPATVIGPGWKLDSTLRAFFIAHAGPSFRFNQALRDLFRNPAGETMADALRLYQDTKDAPSPEIGRQFQYNRHMRDYFRANPDGNRAEAIRLWKEKRLQADALPHSDRPQD